LIFCYHARKSCMFTVRSVELPITPKGWLALFVNGSTVRVFS